MKPRSILDRLALAFHNRINAMKKQANIVDESTDRTPQQTTAAPIHSIDAPWEEMRQDMNRNDIATQGWHAYEGDGRVSAAVQSLGDHATAADNEGRVFRMTLKTEEGDDDDARITQTFERLEMLSAKVKLEAASPQIFKRSFIEGDAYREVVLNVGRSEVVEFKEVPGAREGFVMRKLLNRLSLPHVGWALYNVRFGQLAQM